MISENQQIDWQDLLEGYNRIKKTSHKTVIDMITSLYAKKRTLIKASEVLGVSSQTLQSKMKALNIPRLPAGHRGKSKCIRAILAFGDVSGMTTMEIAKAVNYSRSYVTVCLQQEGIPYQRVQVNSSSG